MQKRNLKEVFKHARPIREQASDQPRSGYQPSSRADSELAFTGSFAPVSDQEERIDITNDQGGIVDVKRRLPSRISERSEHSSPIKGD